MQTTCRNAGTRGRILTGDAPYTIDEMSAPPKRLATHGRANPTGIPYLYLGSLPETAVSDAFDRLGIAPAQQDHAKKKRLTNILRKLGYEYGTVRLSASTTQKRWKRKSI